MQLPDDTRMMAAFPLKGGVGEQGSSSIPYARRNGSACASLTARGGGLPIGVNRIFHFFGLRSPHNSRITEAGEGGLGTGGGGVDEAAEAWYNCFITNKSSPPLGVTR